MGEKMHKTLTVFLLQTFLLLSLHAQNSKTVKSDLLRAIHYDNSNEVRSIAASEKKVINSDPVLKKMVSAYFAAEDKALEELKERARQQRAEDALRLEQAELAKISEEPKHAEATQTQVADANRSLSKDSVELNVVEATQSITASSKQKVEKQEKFLTQNAQPDVQSKRIEKVAPVVKVPKHKISKVLKSKQSSKNSKIRIRTVDIAGKWIAEKREKNVVFKVFGDNTFMLKEHNDRGALVLEGTYEYEDEQLTLEIQKITYNVRSREAAVQRLYQIKTVSSKQIILLDEKGEVAYSFKR